MTVDTRLPVEKYNWIIDFLEHFLKACGSNFMDGHRDITKIGYLYLFFVCAGISSATYTIVTAESEVAMQAVVFLCLASQVYNILTRLKSIQVLIN